MNEHVDTRSAMHLTVIGLMATVLLIAVATGSLAASASQAEIEEGRPAEIANTDTIGPSLKGARQMIVGTWIEDVSDKIGV